MKYTPLILILFVQFHLKACSSPLSKEQQLEAQQDENEWELPKRPGFQAFQGSDNLIFQAGRENVPEKIHPKHTFYYAQIKMLDYEFKGNEASKEQAFEWMEGALNNFTEIGPPFQLWAAIDCYLRWRHEMPEELKMHFRDVLVNSTEYGNHGTQNKRLMAAVARYLATETWPGAVFKSGYSADDPLGKNTIKEMLQTYVTQGEREHNSSTYFTHYFCCMLSLSDLAGDPEIRNMAKLVADWLLISAAAEYHHGYWAAASERVYVPFRETSQQRAGTMILRTYFGGPMGDEWSDSFSYTFLCMVSNYRLPGYIYKIAQEREKPYMHFETHLHPLDGLRTFYLKTYMTDDFAVFSQHENYNDWPKWMNQMIRWGINIQRDAHETCLFIQHPHGGKDTAPEFGETEFGQVFQDKTSLIGIYDIPAGAKHPYLKGWIPSNANVVIDSSEVSGKIFLHYGHTAIAMQLSEKFDWSANNVNFYIRNKSKVSFAVEVFPAEELVGGDEHEQLEYLFEKVNAQTIFTPDYSSVPTVRYTDTNGQELETRLHEGDYLNGEKMDYSNWPLLDNPWVHQDYEGKTLTLNIDGQTIIYDFDKWENTIQ